MMKNSEGMEAKLALQLYYILDDSGATFPQARATLRLLAAKVEREEQAANGGRKGRGEPTPEALEEVRAKPWKEPLL